MSDFQNRFMKIVDSANHTNLDLVGRYKEDSSEAVDDLYRGLSELQHTKAHINELYDRSALKLFFDGLEYRFNTELKKYTLEFTEDVNETFKSYDKKLKNLFVEEGVSGKDIYTHIEGNSEGEYSAFTAKANNIHVDTSLLSDVQTQISNNSEKIIKKSRLKKLFFGIIIPAVLIIAIILTGWLLNIS